MRSYIEENFLYLHPGMELKDDDDFLALGIVDSLGFVELVEEVQSRYGIEVEDVEITEENFGSIDAIAATSQRKRPAELSARTSRRGSSRRGRAAIPTGWRWSSGRTQRCPTANSTRWADGVAAGLRSSASSEAIASRSCSRTASRRRSRSMASCGRRGLLAAQPDDQARQARARPRRPRRPAGHLRRRSGRDGARGGRPPRARVRSSRCRGAGRRRRQPPPRRTSSVDLAAVIYTSGSTGESEGRDPDSSQHDLRRRLDHRVPRDAAVDSVLCVLPLSFDYGLYQLLMCVRVGATLVLEPGFAFPGRVVQLLEEREDHRLCRGSDHLSGAALAARARRSELPDLRS